MLESIQHIEFFYILLAIVAFLYAAVGHGGASGYLALMALFAFAPEDMKSTALLLNLFVAAISFLHFATKGFFKFKLFIFFAIGSIPLAYIGGSMEIDASLYKKILGFVLIFAILKIFGVFNSNKENTGTKNVNAIAGIGTGALVGFFSGLIGIGGGIILTPLILILRWGNVKEAAAVSALFIWVNSAAGLGGQLNAGLEIESDAFVLVGIAVIGGFLGGYFGSKKLNNKGLRIMLGIVLILASLKLFLT